MSIRSWAPGKLITVLRGMWASLTNRKAGVPQRASAMQNMRVQYGVVRTRPGTSSIFNTGRVTGMFNWIEPDNTNLVVYQDGTSIYTYKQSDQTFTPLATGLTNRTPNFAQFDIWLYFVGYGTNGRGTFQPRIYDGGFTDIAFRPQPFVYVCTPTDGGTGFCTAGEHLIGFVYQNRTGYSGKPVTYVGSDPSVAGAPIAITITDQRQINISVTIGGPGPFDDAGPSTGGGVQATLFLIATRADNHNIWYYIPNDDQTGQIGEQPVPLTPGALTTLNFVFSLSDEDIAANLAGDTAQANFLLLAQRADGTGPFFDGDTPIFPNFVSAYGQRMCYGVGTSCYVSDINNPQQIAADLNVVRMQSQKFISFGFQLPGNTSFYLTGDRWTGYVTDNSDSPSTWGEPVQVSDALGAAFPDCVCAVTGGNYAWIVTENGPYVFDGAYGEMPLTYLVSGYDEQGAAVGWNRVNWNAAYAIQIEDDVEDLKLYVIVPLDGATEPNWMFCIDYRQGKSFDSVDISLDTFDQGQGRGKAFSSIAIVKEYATGLNNLWIGPPGSGFVARLDPTTHNDQDAAIDSFWTSGLIRSPGEIQSAMIRVGAMDVWARGNAPLDSDGNPTLLITLYGPDGVQSIPITLLSTQGVPAALTPQPGQWFMTKFDISKIENFYVKFSVNEVAGAWFEISGFRIYMKPDLFNR